MCEVPRVFCRVRVPIRVGARRRRAGELYFCRTGALGASSIPRHLAELGRRPPIAMPLRAAERLCRNSRKDSARRPPRLAGGSRSQGRQLSSRGRRGWRLRLAIYSRASRAAIRVPPAASARPVPSRPNHAASAPRNTVARYRGYRAVATMAAKRNGRGGACSNPARTRVKGMGRSPAAAVLRSSPPLQATRRGSNGIGNKVFERTLPEEPHQFGPG
jgi:hypothetical protein